MSFRIQTVFPALMLSAMAMSPSHAADSKEISTAKSTSPSAGLLNDWLRDQRPAATPWDLGGQIRVRYEDKEDAGTFANRDFVAIGPDNRNDTLMLRTKLHLGYTPQSWLTFYVEGRDSRSWFDERDPRPDTDKFDLHQFYLRAGGGQDFPLSLKVGRQELNYGDERFIGSSDWSNLGRVFDAAKARFENEWFWVDALAGRVVIPYDGSVNEANDYDWLSGFYASSDKIIPKQETQLFFLARNVESASPNAIAPGVGGPGDRDIYTPGLRVRSRPGQFSGWDYGAELAGQFGGIKSLGRTMDHTAFAADILAGYTWEEAAARPRFGLEYTYASGDTNPWDSRHRTFEPLFGTNHKFYGLMDLFGLRNIHNPSASLSVKPLPQLTLRLDYHLFWLAETTDALYPENGPARSGGPYGISPRNNPFVGSELDFVASYQPKPWLEMQLGYGHFFTGSYVDQSVFKSRDADWFYLQAKFTF